MAWTKHRRLTVLRTLWDIDRELGDLGLHLRFQGDLAGAKEADAKEAKVSAEIDRLVARLLADWADDAAQVTADLRAAERGLEEAVKRVRDGVQVAKSVAKALAYVDDALALARGVVD